MTLPSTHGQHVLREIPFLEFQCIEGAIEQLLRMNADDELLGMILDVFMRRGNSGRNRLRALGRNGQAEKPKAPNAGAEGDEYGDSGRKTSEQDVTLARSCRMFAKLRASRREPTRREGEKRDDEQGDYHMQARTGTQDKDTASHEKHERAPRDGGKTRYSSIRGTLTGTRAQGTSRALSALRSRPLAKMRPNLVIRVHGVEGKLKMQSAAIALSSGTMEPERHAPHPSKDRAFTWNPPPPTFSAITHCPFRRFATRGCITSAATPHPSSQR